LVAADDALERTVYTGDEYKPFGDFTVAEVEDRATTLRAATGWGPTARVGSVARAWAELGRAMTGAGAAQVRELAPDVAHDFARRVWVVPPGGSLLK
jgi:hypothetical protein